MRAAKSVVGAPWPAAGGRKSRQAEALQHSVIVSHYSTVQNLVCLYHHVCLLLSLNTRTRSSPYAEYVPVLGGACSDTWCMLLHKPVTICLCDHCILLFLRPGISYDIWRYRTISCDISYSYDVLSYENMIPYSPKFYFEYAHGGLAPSWSHWWQ